MKNADTKPLTLEGGLPCLRDRYYSLPLVQAPVAAMPDARLVIYPAGQGAAITNERFGPDALAFLAGTDPQVERTRG
jgi:hypothetical protein